MIVGSVRSIRWEQGEVSQMLFRMKDETMEFNIFIITKINNHETCMTTSTLINWYLFYIVKASQYQIRIITVKVVTYEYYVESFDIKQCNVLTQNICGNIKGS